MEAVVRGLWVGAQDLPSGSGVTGRPCCGGSGDADCVCFATPIAPRTLSLLHPLIVTLRAPSSRPTPCLPFAQHHSTGARTQQTHTRFPPSCFTTLAPVRAAHRCSSLAP